VVTVGGEIDLYTAPQLRNELVESLEAGARRLVIDMSRAEFCDSTGISVLLSAMKRSRDKGGDLVNIAQVFARSAMLDVLLYDLALHQVQGNVGVTHGRSYMKDKSRAADQE
jgi:anti-sigma B factor antagonist